MKTDTSESITVWDPLVRIFHWSLVSAFFIAYITEDHYLDLHIVAGYSVLALLAFRLIWGIIGSRHARFKDFVKSPEVIISYIKDVLQFRAKRYLGHNPAGGAMVIALLITLLLIVLSGLLLLGLEEHTGPLADMVSNWPYWSKDVLEEVHEFFAHLSLLLVFLHVGGVLLASLQHMENLLASMWHGRKKI